MKKLPRRVRCPTCRRWGDWFAGPYGPFCSQRCKLVDLGRWLGEEYRFSEPLAPASMSPTEAERSETDSSVSPPDRDARSG